MECNKFGAIRFNGMFLLFSMHLLLALLVVGCDGSRGSGGSDGSSRSSDSITILPIDSINNSNVSHFVIEGTCHPKGSSNLKASESKQSHGEAKSESDTPLEEGISKVSKPSNKETSLEENDGTDLGTLTDGVEGAVIKLSITPLSGRNVISQQITCVGGTWTTKPMDMTRFYKEASFVVTAVKVLESGEDGPLDTLTIPNHFQCPWGYVPVPASKEEVSKSFCVAKYEMKNKNSSSGLAVLSQGELFSMPSETPHKVKQREAQVNCQELGRNNYGEYDLIRNDEWQTLTRNIERVSVNWGNGSVGSDKGLNRGHSTIEANAIGNLEASDDDTKACYGLPVYDDTNNQYVSMSDPSDTLDGQCKISWHSRKRTHQLSNKEIIWDLAGNGCEWIKENLGSGHQVLTAGINDNIYISQIANLDGDDADTYPLVSFDYKLTSGVITESGGPFDETRKILKDLFGPSGDYIALNTPPITRVLPSTPLNQETTPIVIREVITETSALLNLKISPQTVATLFVGEGILVELILFHL